MVQTKNTSMRIRGPSGNIVIMVPLSGSRYHVEEKE